MAIEIKHEVREQTERIEKSQSWSATTGGYRVSIDRRADDFTTISVCPEDFRDMRMPLLQFHPKSLGDVLRLRAEAESILSAVVDVIQAAGLEDMRSNFDLMMEESDRRRDEFMASLRKENA